MNRFRENGKSRFLREECEENYDIGYEAKMLIHNRPEGLLPLQTVREDDKCYCEYNVSGLSALKDMEKSGDMGRYIYSVLEGMYRISDIIHEYFLNAESLILKPEYIFLRRETGNVYFCYLPGKHCPVQGMLQELMEYFMRFLNPTGEEDVLLLYGLYQKSREGNATLKTLFEFWKENRKNAENGYRKAGPDYIEDGFAFRGAEGAVKPTYKEKAYEIIGLEDEKQAIPDFGGADRSEETLKKPGGEETRFISEDGEAEREEAEIRREEWADNNDFYDSPAPRKDAAVKDNIKSFIMKYKIELMVGGAVLAGAAVIILS